MSKRFLSLFLCLALLLPVFSLIAASAEEPVKVQILVNINVDTEGTDVNDNDYIHYIEEKTGVDIEFINEATSAYYPQKLNTMMASNQLPDAVMLMGDTQRSDLARLAYEGLLMPLDDLLVDYPNLTTELKPEAWEICKYDGKTYAVPFQRYDSSPYMTFVRKDWLEKLNINPEDVVTIDDWYQMLKRFVEEDPDGDGEKNSFGIVSTTSGTHFTNFTFLDSFGAAKAKYVDGELLPNFLLPEYKEWLRFMHKLYIEGILDPEYIVSSDSVFWEKIGSGKYGTFLWFWGLQEYLSKGLSRDDLVAMKPPVKADGSDASYVYSSPNRHMMAITADCKHPEAVLKIWNWACSEEGGIFLYAGVEGKDYSVVDGNITMFDDRKGKNLGWRQLTLGIEQPNAAREPYRSILSQSFGDLGMEHLRLSGEYGSYNTLELYCPIFTELSQYDLTSPVAEFVDKVITGELDLDAEWDNFVANWRKAGGDLKIKLSTDWYNNVYTK